MLGMVQVGVVTDRSPAPSPPFITHGESSQHGGYIGHHESPAKYRRTSTEQSSEDEDGINSRESSREAKTPPSDLSHTSQNSISGSPKSDTFFPSPMSVCGEDISSRSRTVLDLSMPSAFSRKQTARAHTHSELTYAHAYSPLSSTASLCSSSGSPSATPEVKMDEISIHDIAKEVTDRRSRSSSFSGYLSQPTAATTAPMPDFELPKNFYGYYVYQLELASRYSSTMRTPPGSINGGTTPNPLPVGKVKPTVKAETRDEDTVSYGSLLEQALRNGLKRSPGEVQNLAAEKKSKVAAPVQSPPPSQTGSRSSTTGQISVEDVAKTSLRELLHSKQLQEAKAHMASAQGSRSSSPSVNLKTLLETQSREGLKSQMGFRPSAAEMVAAFSPNALKHAALQQQLHMQNGKPYGPGPAYLYPHIMARCGSPGMSGKTNGEMVPGFQGNGGVMGHGGGFKHRKLLEWSPSDVRDWISTLNYCSEFADIFLQQSVDGVALTLLNETHLMKNFGMKLGPAIKLRCAVWEILGLCQAVVSGSHQQMPQIAMPQFLNQKQIPIGHCIPQHHNGSLPKP